MFYGNFKDLFSKTVSDDASRITAFNIAKNPKYKVYLGVIISIDSKFFDIILLLTREQKKNSITDSENQQ